MLEPEFLDTLICVVILIIIPNIDQRGVSVQPRDTPNLAQYFKVENSHPHCQQFSSWSKRRNAGSTGRQGRGRRSAIAGRRRERRREEDTVGRGRRGERGRSKDAGKEGKEDGEEQGRRGGRERRGARTFSIHCDSNKQDTARFPKEAAPTIRVAEQPKQAGGAGSEPEHFRPCPPFWSEVTPGGGPAARAGERARRQVSERGLVLARARRRGAAGRPFVLGRGPPASATPAPRFPSPSAPGGPRLCCRPTPPPSRVGCGPGGCGGAPRPSVGRSQRLWRLILGFSRLPQPGLQWRSE